MKTIRLNGHTVKIEHDTGYNRHNKFSCKIDHCIKCKKGVKEYA